MIQIWRRGLLPAREVRRGLFKTQGGRCATCTREAASELVYMIPPTDANVLEYGLEVIFHPRNCRLVCGAQACADYWNIGCKPHSEELLVAEILKDLGDGKDRS